jgi:hypothetical protein
MGNTHAKTNGTDENAGIVKTQVAQIEERIAEGNQNASSNVEEPMSTETPESIEETEPDVVEPATSVEIETEVVDVDVVETETETETDVVETEAEVSNPEPADEPADEPASTGLIGSLVGGAYNAVSYMIGGPAETAETVETVETDEVEDIEDIEEAEPYEAPVVGVTEEGKEMKLRRDGTIDVDTSVLGSKFKEMYKNCSVVKLTNESCCHNDFQFVEGLNEDVNEFNYAEVCGPDGLYFCTERDSEQWFDYLEDITYVWDVEIPDDARVCVYDEKIKSNKFVLSNKRTLPEFIGERVRKMVHTGRTYEEVFEYIDRNIDYIGEDYDALNDQMKDLINIDPAAYYNMPDYLVTPVVEAEVERLGLSQN